MLLHLIYFVMSNFRHRFPLWFVTQNNLRSCLQSAQSCKVLRMLSTLRMNLLRLPHLINWNTWQHYLLMRLRSWGKTSHADARLPTSTDTAVIMYTSGSTGLPKVHFCLKIFFFLVYSFSISMKIKGKLIGVL